MVGLRLRVQGVGFEVQGIGSSFSWFGRMQVHGDHCRADSIDIYIYIYANSVHITRYIYSWTARPRSSELDT
jgi:hypothetical protein